MAIDRKKAIHDLSQIKVKGNEEGLIPAFGVLIQFLPANFWNTFTEKMLMSVDDKHLEEVEKGLERAAGECGYHTGWGIINSEEFFRGGFGMGRGRGGGGFGRGIGHGMGRQNRFRGGQ